jgi:hypothetical protein
MIYRPRFRRDGETKQSENCVARIGLAGKGTTFALGTPNRAAAAIKARDIYNYVVANGLAAACQKFKRTVQPKDTNHCGARSHISEKCPGTVFLQRKSSSVSA